MNKKLFLCLALTLSSSIISASNIKLESEFKKIIKEEEKSEIVNKMELEHNFTKNDKLNINFSHSKNYKLDKEDTYVQYDLITKVGLFRTKIDANKGLHLKYGIEQKFNDNLKIQAGVGYYHNFRNTNKFLENYYTNINLQRSKIHEIYGLIDENSIKEEIMKLAATDQTILPMLQTGDYLKHPAVANLLGERKIKALKLKDEIIKLEKERMSIDQGRALYIRTKNNIVGGEVALKYKNDFIDSTAAFRIGYSFDKHKPFGENVHVNSIMPELEFKTILVPLENISISTGIKYGNDFFKHKIVEKEKEKDRFSSLELEFKAGYDIEKGNLLVTPSIGIKKDNKKGRINQYWLKENYEVKRIEKLNRYTITPAIDTIYNFENGLSLKSMLGYEISNIKYSISERNNYDDFKNEQGILKNYKLRGIVAKLRLEYKF